MKILDSNKAQFTLLLLATTTLILFFRLGPHVIYNPDAYYHLGCAELYAQRGWYTDFPWLKYTVLGKNFPNVHFLQHLLFAPFTLIFSKLTLLTIAPLITTLLLTFSIYTVLKLWGVSNPHLWTFFGLLCSPLMLIYLTLLKGGSFFFIFVTWYVYALVSRKHKTLLFVTWLSVYAYVGAPILLMLAVFFSMTISIIERSVYYKPLLYTGIGLLCGLLINPFSPENIFHIQR